MNHDVIFSLLTSEFESIDLTLRFLLLRGLGVLLRVDNITVGVIVKEFAMSFVIGGDPAVALFIWQEVGDSNSTLDNGDFGSSGKKELKFVNTGLDVMGVSCTFVLTIPFLCILLFDTMLGCDAAATRFADVVGFWGLTRITPCRFSIGSIVLEGGWGFTNPLLFLHLDREFIKNKLSWRFYDLMYFCETLCNHCHKKLFIALIVWHFWHFLARMTSPRYVYNLIMYIQPWSVTLIHIMI